MKSLFFSLLIATMMMGPSVLRAQQPADSSTGLTLPISDSEEVTFTYGGDIRSRWEFFDRTVPSPNGTGTDDYPPNQYLRIRTRLWGTMNFHDEMKLNIGLGNRVHFVSSSPSDPNNVGSSTWKFPDEIYIDKLNVEIPQCGPFGLILGRQSFSFGNGMIFSDPTPFDQGRSAYTDGLKLTYSSESQNDTLSVFFTYDEWKDPFVFINDQNRRLRSGDIFTVGFYGTHTFSEALKTDVYYLFNNIDDRHPAVAERNHPADSSNHLHTIGARVFGKPATWFDYSVELAQQAGRNAQHGHNKGQMADIRLNIYDPSAQWMPIVKLEFTHFSGDKRNSKDSHGWNSLMAKSPLWGEELLPIMLNGNWTNLNLARIAFNSKLTKDLSFELAATDCYQDRAEGNHHLGLLTSFLSSYKLNEHVSFALQFAHLEAGALFNQGHDSNWGRFEVTFTF